MTSWRLAYENHFPQASDDPGTTLLNLYRAAEGSQSAQFGSVFLMFAAIPGIGIGSGRHLAYEMREPIRDVIGLDVSMDIGLAGLYEGPLPLFSSEERGLFASLHRLPDSGAGYTASRLVLRLDDAIQIIDGVRFRHRPGPPELDRRRLRFRWATNGQMHVWLDGLLLAYDPGVKSGHRFHFRRFWVGDAERPNNGVVNATLSHLRVLELREESAVREVGMALNPEHIPKISERCAHAARSELQQLLRETRHLMAAFSASQTSAWRKGQETAPFTAISREVHKAGTAAGLALAGYLRDGSDAARQEVMLQLTRLLEALAADQPTLFRALAEHTREAQERLDRHCRRATQEIRATNPALVQRLDPLVAELNELVRRLGGGS